jgi:anti-sigma regulatory factor (Ser/Thr protein kinase)
VTERRRFARERESVPKARHFAQRVLSGLPEEIVSTVALMVSELATNAVQHAATDFEVAIEQVDGEIRVEVSDNGGGQATRRSPAPSESSGRGLQLVEVMADQWGVRVAPRNTGKTVWFQLVATTESESFQSSAS